MEHERDRVGVVEQVRELGADVPVVHVHRHRAELLRREERLEVLGRVHAHDRDLVVGPDAGVAQHAREPRRPIVELGERQPALAADDRDPIGPELGDGAPRARKGTVGHAEQGIRRRDEVSEARLLGHPRDHAGVVEAIAGVEDADAVRVALGLDGLAVAEADRHVRTGARRRDPGCGSLAKWNSNAPGVCSACCTVMVAPCSFSHTYWCAAPSGIVTPDRAAAHFVSSEQSNDAGFGSDADAVEPHTYGLPCWLSAVSTNCCVVAFGAPPIVDVVRSGRRSGSRSAT